MVHFPPHTMRLLDCVSSYCGLCRFWGHMNLGTIPMYSSCILTFLSSWVRVCRGLVGHRSTTHLPAPVPCFSAETSLPLTSFFCFLKHHQPVSGKVHRKVQPGWPSCVQHSGFRGESGVAPWCCQWAPQPRRRTAPTNSFSIQGTGTIDPDPEWLF